MLRLLKIGLIVAISIPLVVWGGFRLWLAAQPNEFRASIEDYSSLEFLEILYDHAFPRPLPDRADFGRRTYPGRGHSPWVLRCSLDGRPRMLVIALADELWLAYSTQTASIHQFWRGDVDFTGPVYDARHGFEPTSRGTAYAQPPTPTAWRIRSGQEWKRASVRWQGHGFDPASGALWIRFELLDPESHGVRSVTEWVEQIHSEVAPRAGLERRFEFGPGPDIALVTEPADAILEIENGAERVGEWITFNAPAERVGEWITFNAPTARIRQRYAAPGIPIDRSASLALASDPFAQHDCHTCHNVRERVVGPAWGEIAQRYRGANREVTIGQLATRIREGSVGHWGSIPMSPHPELGRVESAVLARIILETEPTEPPAFAERPTATVSEGNDANATWIFGSPTEPPPDRLHPALVATPIDPPGFTPRVGGLAWLPDGRLAVATWDPDGSVFAIEGWQGPRDQLRVQRIAEGLHEPLGLLVADAALYVMQKQEITQLLDHDDDGWIDEYRTITNEWRVTSNFHEFGFGLAARGDDLYGSLSVCVLVGGKSCREQTPDRGKIFRLSLVTGEIEFIASGLRTPNGLTVTPNGDLFVTDNQGDWLPASKLIRVRPGEDYGWRAPGGSWRAPGGGERAPGDARDPARVTPPTLWLPQNEIGNSPTQPLYLSDGPYAGQMIWGDIFNGGLKRGALKEVGGVLQGAALHFSGGLDGPVNRLLAAPGGGFIVGQIGSRGNWGEYGKKRFGLELLRFTNQSAFEPLRIAATPDGFDVYFTRALALDVTPEPEDVRVSDWYYVPSEIYGGPKYDLRELAVESIELSPDRRMASIVVPHLKPGRVVYLRLGRAFRSEDDESLWVNEAWYTMSVLPARDSERGDTEPPVASGAPPNTLTPAEVEAGWRLLFDGRSFEGWKLYGDDEDPGQFWAIRDAALEFTRDVSLAHMIWNHINPFVRSAADLMTKERFGDFELTIDWRISPGGNSGIFYLVPDERSGLAWDRGLEMQVLDDAGHADGQIERHRAGDLYDLQSLARDAASPVGEWNTARIRVEGDHIQHWLNGQQIVDITRGSPDWNQAVAASKFAGTEGYGRAERGHISLQDHGDVVWYRNIKIREGLHAQPD